MQGLREGEWYSPQTVGIESRLIGIESRLIGIESRLIGIESRLIGMKLVLCPEQRRALLPNLLSFLCLTVQK
jgi:hypothetical protein